MTRSRRPALTGLAGLALALLLSSCSGGEDPETPAPSSSAAGETSAEASPSDEASPAAEKPYLPVPESVTLTPQGSRLAVGDGASVAFRPRQGVVGVLDLRVTGLEETTFEKSFQGWKLDEKTMRSTPYFVDVTAKNLASSDLGGRTVPLYLLTDDDTLVEPTTFEGDFTPCPSTPLPEKFAKGDSTKTCLVYLAPPGLSLAGVAFRPDEDFDAITWTGRVAGSDDGGKKAGGRSGGKSGGKTGRG